MMDVRSNVVLSMNNKSHLKVICGLLLFHVVT